MWVTCKPLRFSTNFQSDTTMGGLGVIDSLGTSLDVRRDAVVVAGSKVAQVVGAVDGDSVIRGIVAKGSGIARDLALSDVIGSLSTDEETVAAKDSVSGESGTL